MEDNAAAKATAETVGVTDANKHIRVKFHYVRECVEDKTLRMVMTPSLENPADALTKAPTTLTLPVMMKAAGLLSLRESEEQDGHPDQGGCLGIRRDVMLHASAMENTVVL